MKKRMTLMVVLAVFSIMSLIGVTRVFASPSEWLAESNRFIYATTNHDGLLIYIEPIGHWNKYHYLTDSYTSTERKILQPLLERLSLVEREESTFELINNISENELRQRMNDLGFLENEDFQSFITKCEIDVK